MIEKILSLDNLGTKSQIIYIVRLLSNAQASYADLRHACSSKEFSFSVSFEGVVVLLEYVGVIANNNGVISLRKTVELDKSIEGFMTLLFSQLSKDKVLHDFINSDNFYYDNTSKVISLLNHLIELDFSALRNLLINLGLLSRDNLIPNHLVVQSEFQEWFIETVIPLIEKSKIKNRSLKSLEHLHQVQKSMGMEAEEFVLKYERERRSGHPNCSNIKIVSEEDTSAGYDILSYQTDTSIFLDKHIEVKSYDDNESFYWSKNEIEVAKIKQDKYYLYLVKRSEMSSSGYEPIVIQNPYKEVLNNTTWKKTVEKYFIYL